MSNIIKFWSTDSSSFMYAFKCGIVAFSAHLVRLIITGSQWELFLQDSGESPVLFDIRLTRAIAYLAWLSVTTVVIPAWLLSILLRRGSNPIWSRLEGNMIWFVPILTVLNYVFR
jgi:hypothetical protein